MQSGEKTTGSLRHEPARSDNAASPAWRGAAILALIPVLASAACIANTTVYHPLNGLQRPVVVDVALENLPGARIALNCFESNYLDATASQKLCDRIAVLLRNQGAAVRPLLNGRSADVGTDADFVGADVVLGDAPSSAPDTSQAAEADLIVDLRARLINREEHAVLRILSYATATLVPAISEQTFAQDITVRDTQGFVLASHTLEARIVRYSGLGYGAVNAMLNLVRDTDEKLTGNSFKEDLSRDFYGQISQIVFDARMRLQILRAAARPEKAFGSESPAMALVRIPIRVDRCHSEGAASCW